MGRYAKLFSSITESSLWCVGSKEARLLFVSMLARADASGVVEASLPGLAKIASLTIKETEAALTELTLPDVYDRSGKAEGRRVLKVEGGWALVNFNVYRERRNEDERREYMRTYMKNYRDANVNKSKQSKPPLAQAEAEAEATTLTTLSTSSPLAPSVCKKKQQAKVDHSAEAIAIYELYPRKVARPAALKAIAKALGKCGFESLKKAVLSFATSCAGKDAQYIPHPATWFNQERWADQPAQTGPRDEREIGYPVQKASAAYIDWAEGITDGINDAEPEVITPEQLERDARECMGEDSAEPEMGVGSDVGEAGGDVSGGPRQDVGNKEPELPLST